MTKLKKITLGFLSENCYLVWNEATGEGYVVDPGCQPDSILRVIESEKVQPKAVLLTHGHVDHIGALPQIAETYGIGVWMHKEEQSLYASPDNALRPWMDAVQGLPQPLAEFPVIAGLKVEVIHTPGHTRGGVCYYFPEEGFVLTGDTLFRGTYGRTDFPGGDEVAIFRSIREKLLVLPEEVKVYPGHEASSTIGAEKRNPIFA